MFITLEGPEGGGKTTQMNRLAGYLTGLGYDVLKVREPGGSAIGEQIRAVLTDMGNTAMQPRTEILLFLASRAQFVDEVVQPALKAGKLVLCDRYADSTLAYQGYGHRVDLEVLRRLLDFATGGLYPDLTFLLDVDTQRGLERKRPLAGEWNRLDAYPADFHQRVREGYLELAAQEPQRWVVVDANVSAEEVQEKLRAEAVARLV